jgi:hypothetical protein
MADILNFDVKDDSLKNILSNNPYYIDIKGSVNICLIRCGQEIDNCKSVYFQTMTNYGKILVLNHDDKKEDKASTCNIKVAFDTNNDNKDDKGNALYKFTKAFITVPSLHRLNGQLYDLETFLVFSSVQKNGNILYIVLCVLSNGTSNVPQGDPKLLNYKLMTELFTNDNKVPERGGTNAINGKPNPIDLSSFIPPLGLRNFYDYTHPQNNTTSFRIFQTPMAVSNEVLNDLRLKLTPGIVYENFKSAILKTINPFEGLFFYFNEDLTSRYESLKRNKQNENYENELYKNKSDDKPSSNNKLENSKNNKTISKEILEEQEKHEDEIFKKIDLPNSFDKIEDEDEDKEAFDDKVSKDIMDKGKVLDNNQNMIMIICALCFIFAYNLFNLVLTNHVLFQSPRKISDTYIDENHSFELNEFSKILGTKFKSWFLLIIQGLIVSISFIYFICYSSNESNKIFENLLISNVLFILILSVLILYLNCRYIFCRIKTLFDTSYTYKEQYFFKMVGNNILKLKNIPNLFKCIWSNDFSKFNQDIMNSVNESFNAPSINQTGGSYTGSSNGIRHIVERLAFANDDDYVPISNELRHAHNGLAFETNSDNDSINNKTMPQNVTILPKIDKRQYVNKMSLNPAPGVNRNNNLSNVVDKQALQKINSIRDLFNPENIAIISKRFKEAGWITNLYSYLAFIIIAFILVVSLFQFNGLINGYLCALNILTNLSISATIYVPLILIFTFLTVFLGASNNVIQNISVALGIFSLISVTIMSFTSCTSITSIIFFWIFMALIFITVLLGFYLYFFNKSNQTESVVGGADSVNDGADSVNDGDGTYGIVGNGGGESRPIYTDPEHSAGRDLYTGDGEGDVGERNLIRGGRKEGEDGEKEPFINDNRSGNIPVSIARINSASRRNFENTALQQLGKIRDHMTELENLIRSNPNYERNLGAIHERMNQILGNITNLPTTIQQQFTQLQELIRNFNQSYQELSITLMEQTRDKINELNPTLRDILQAIQGEPQSLEPNLPLSQRLNNIEYQIRTRSNKINYEIQQFENFTIRAIMYLYNIIMNFFNQIHYYLNYITGLLQHIDQKINKLQGSVNYIDSTLKTKVEYPIHTLQDRVTELQASIAEQTELIRNQGEERVRLQDNIDFLIRKKDDCEEEKTELKINVERLKNYINDLQSQLQKLNQEKHENQEELNRLKQELYSKRDELYHQERKIYELTIQIKEKDNEISELQYKLAQQEETIKEYKQKISDLYDTITILLKSIKLKNITNKAEFMKVLKCIQDMLKAQKDFLRGRNTTKYSELLLKATEANSKDKILRLIREKINPTHQNTRIINQLNGMLSDFISRIHSEIKHELSLTSSNIPNSVNSIGGGMVASSAL